VPTRALEKNDRWSGGCQTLNEQPWTKGKKQNQTSSELRSFQETWGEGKGGIWGGVRLQCHSHGKRAAKSQLSKFGLMKKKANNGEAVVARVRRERTYPTMERQRRDFSAGSL